MHRQLLACTGALLSAVLLSACSGDDTEAEPTPEAHGSTPASTAPPSPEPTADGSLTPSPSGPPSELTTATVTATPTPRTGATGAYCTAVEAAEDAEDITALKPAVRDLVATLPGNAGADAIAGLDLLAEAVTESSSFEEMGKRLEDTSARGKEQVEAYAEYEEQTCDE